MATNQVTVSAVPFNQQTQSFGGTSKVVASNVAQIQTPTLSTPQNMTAPAVQKGVPTADQNLAAFNQSMVNSANTYKAPTSSNVPVTNIGTQPVNIPTQAPTQVQPTSNYALSGIQNIPTPVADAASNISQTMLQLIPQLQGQSQELNNQKQALGVDAMRTNLQNLNNQILQKQAELSQDDVSLAQGLQNIEDQTIPMQFITGQQLSVEKRANLAKAVKTSQINMLNASALAAQGNIALASDLAQQAVDAKFAPIKDMYNTLQLQLETIQPLLNAEEKKVASQQSMVADVQKQLLTIKADQQKNIANLLMQAQANGIDSGTYTRALNAYNNGASDVEVAGIIGAYGGKEYLANKDVLDMSRNTLYTGTNQITVDNGYTLEDFKKGIASTESSNNYKAIGPATSSGDKAYGKYQVMGVNIPSWTKEALGYSMTPTQFLNSPDAQEKVFEFQSMQNYSKYGNWDDVASVWFSGKPLSGNNASDGYNTVPAYVAKVRQAMGVPSQPTALSQVTNPSVVTWANSVRAGGDIKDVPKALQTQVLAYNQQNVQNNPQTQNIVEKINQIDNIINNPALSSVVGPNIFGRGVFSSIATGVGAGATAGAIAGTPVFGIGAIPGAVAGGIIGGIAGYASTDQFSGQAQNFIADVEQLTSKETLDTLINAKAKGATFGALSIPELALLQQSATKINKWAMHVDNDPNKPVIGYNTDEQSFLKELEQVKRLAQKGIATAGGNILGNTIGGAYATSLIQSQNSTTAMNTLNYGFK